MGCAEGGTGYAVDIFLMLARPSAVRCERLHAANVPGGVVAVCSSRCPATALSVSRSRAEHELVRSGAIRNLS